MKRLALIHTLAGVIPIFDGLCRELLPRTDVVNLLDESIMRDLVARGHLDADIRRRVCRLALAAQEAGAAAAMLTCSSISPCADTAAELVTIPVLKVDEPMAMQAVRRSDLIGVVATLSTTLRPTVALLHACALRLRRRVRVVAQLCENAFAARAAGDIARHNRLIAEGMQRLARRLAARQDFQKTRPPTIVLAQASMAEAVSSLKLPPVIRVLTSPRLAVQHAAHLLDLS